MERKLTALIAKLQSNPQQAQAILDRLRNDDPELFQAILRLMQQGR